MSRVRVIVGAIALLASMVAAPAGADAATAPKWTIEKSTNRAGVFNWLSDVSCPSAAKCVAVGGYRNHALPNAPLPAGTLIETFSGGKWTTNASPGQGGLSVLGSVSCPTVSRCYAVGSSHTSPDPLIVTSNGGPWSQMTAPSLPDVSTLTSISCPDATHCVAVGVLGTDPTSALVLRLANGMWTAMVTPTPGTSHGLSAVSCATVTRCMAVGWRTTTSSLRTLAMQLVGGTWSVNPTPNRNANGQLGGVACTAATRCTATGHYYTGGVARTLLETWSGSAWSLAPSPTFGTEDNAIGSPSCLVASRCVMAGRAHLKTVIARLTNGTWSVDAIPSRSLPYTLSAVDCPTASTCVAVGSGWTSTPLVSKTVIIRSTG